MKLVFINVKMVKSIKGEKAMPFVQAKCTNCGGVLAVDETLDAAVCPFCNTPYVVEKAINNYNITNNISVQNGGVVNIIGNVKKDFEIKAGTLIKYIGESQDVIVPDTVKFIENKAFMGLSITKVSLPNGLSKIGKEAFKNCKMLQEINLPDSIIIEQEAFCNCINLKNVIIPVNAKVGNFAFCNTPLWNVKNGVCKKCGEQLKKVSLVDRLYKYKYRCPKCNTFYK